MPKWAIFAKNQVSKVKSCSFDVAWLTDSICGIKARNHACSIYKYFSTQCWQRQHELGLRPRACCPCLHLIEKYLYIEQAWFLAIVSTLYDLSHQDAPLVSICTVVHLSWIYMVSPSKKSLDSIWWYRITVQKCLHSFNYLYDYRCKIWNESTFWLPHWIEMYSYTHGRMTGTEWYSNISCHMLQ